MSVQHQALSLGPKLAEARPGYWSNYILLIVGFLIGLCGSVSILLNLIGTQSLPALFIGTVMMLIGGWTMWSGYNLAYRHVEQIVVYENGLMHVTAGHATLMPWEEVTGIYKTAFVNHQGRKQRDIWTVVDRQGRHIYLGDRAALGLAVEEKMWPRLWQQIVGELSRGENVCFGPITISRLGISYQREHVPWHMLKAIEFGRSVTVFTQTEKLKWKHAIPRNIPNLPLLRRAIQGFQQSV